MTADITRGGPDDAHQIARVHVQAWQETYAHLIPTEALARLDIERRAARWAGITDQGTTEIWVAKTASSTAVDGRQQAATLT